MAIPLALQLFTVREAAQKDFPAVLKDVADMGYRGVETAGLHGMAARDVSKILDDLGLEVAGCHGPLPTDENINELVNDCSELGTTRVVTGFGADELQTAQDAAAAAGRLEDAAGLAAERGLELGYHNHWWEFDHDFDGVVPHAVLMNEVPAAFAEIDVYWAAYGGVEPIDVITALKGRSPLLHIKDGPLEKDQPHTAVGAGALDIPAIINAADAEVTQWLIVELDRCATDIVQAARDSAEFMTSNGLAAGR